MNVHVALRVCTKILYIPYSCNYASLSLLLDLQICQWLRYVFLFLWTPHSKYLNITTGSQITNEKESIGDFSQIFPRGKQNVLKYQPMTGPSHLNTHMHSAKGPKVSYHRLGCMELEPGSNIVVAIHGMGDEKGERN